MSCTVWSKWGRTARDLSRAMFKSCSGANGTVFARIIHQPGRSTLEVDIVRHRGTRTLATRRFRTLAAAKRWAAPRVARFAQGR